MPLDVETLLAQNPQNVVHVDLAGDELRQNWRRYTSEWAQRSPFYLVSKGVPYVLVGRYDDYKAVSMDTERFSVKLPRKPGSEAFDYMGGLRHVGQVDGEAHDRVRRLLAPAFMPARVLALEKEIRGFITEMIDAIEAKGGAFDAVSDFSSQLIPRALLDVMLRLQEHQKQAFEEMHHAIGLMQHLKPGEAAPEGYLTAFKQAKQTILEMLEQRRQSPGTDFVSAMVQARDQGDKLSDEELVGNIFAICAAGLGTTTTGMANVLFNLGRHPGQFDQVKADPSLIPQAIEESLRYSNSGFLTFPRFALQDTEVGGTAIAQGMPVIPSTQAACYDPKQFPDPLRFDIQRKPKQITTFGIGPHFCVGNQIARFIMTTGMKQFIERLPKLRLAESDFQPHYQGMMGELALKSLPMRWD